MNAIFALVLAAGALAASMASTSVFAAVSGTTTLYDVRQPPWFKGKPPAAPGRVAAAAVRVAPAPFGTPDGWVPRAALEELAAQITARLAGRDDLRVIAVDLPDEGRPAVRVGCAGESVIGDDLGEDCDAARRAMHLAMTQSSKAWRSAFSAARTASPADAPDHVLLIEVAVRDHWLSPKGLSFKKEVRLGTGYAQPAPWLTSLDTPVAVLQLEGVLVDREGKVVRAGVEGIYATRTRFGESVAGLQRVLTDEDVVRVRTTLRRADRQEGALAWEQSVDALVRGLLGR